MPAAFLRVAARALLVALATLVAVSGTQTAQGAAKATAEEARSVASAPHAGASAPSARVTAPDERDTPGCGKSGDASPHTVPSTRAGSDAGIIPLAGRGTARQDTAPAHARATAEHRRPPGPSLAQLSVLRL
jgi:hypothetical protein